MLLRLTLLYGLLLVATVAAQQPAARLRIAYEWHQLDFAYATDADRQMAIATGAFVPANVVPVGLEAYDGRLFVTLPRWQPGVPASLAYIDVTSTANDGDKAPKLHPYPSWGAHQIDPFGNPPEIVSPVRISADRCGRLWVLDSGRTATNNTTSPASATQFGATTSPTTLDFNSFNTNPITTTNSPADGANTPSPAAVQLLVYDLRNDNLLRRYTLPADQQNAANSRFDSLAIEVATAADGSAACDDTYAYLADSGKPGLVVYSWRTLESWRVQHHFFNGDPLAGEFNVSGTAYQQTIGVYGLAIGAASVDAKPKSAEEQQQQLPQASQQRLYFHPLSSTAEFSVDTALLHNRTHAVESTNDRATFAEYRQHGGRGHNGQSGASVLADGVLFFTAPNRNALTCWRARPMGQIDERSLGVVVEDVERLVYPSDVKADAAGELWLLSNNQQRFERHDGQQQQQLQQRGTDEVLFRIWKGSVRDAIAGTICERPLETITTTTTSAPTTVHDHSQHDHSQHDHSQHNHNDHSADGGQQTRARPAPNAAAVPSLSAMVVAMVTLTVFAVIPVAYL